MGGGGLRIPRRALLELSPDDMLPISELSVRFTRLGSISKSYWLRFFPFLLLSFYVLSLSLSCCM